MCHRRGVGREKNICNPVKNNIIWQKRPTIITTWDNRRGEKQKMEEGEMA